MLSDLYPLLRAVQPAELNMTLNAIATALEGRGDQLGENLEIVDGYLKRLNPEIPALVEDLRLTAQVSDIYADVLPEVATILRNTITTTQHARGPRGQAQRALQRRRPLLRDHRALPRRQRRQPDPARRARPRPAARSSPSTPRSTPACSRASSRPATCRPRRSAASPCTSCSRRCPTSRAATGRRTRPCYGDTRGPHCGSPARPALDPGEPAAHAARLRRRRRRADRQGHLAQCDRLATDGRPAGPAATATPAAATRRPCSRGCSAPSIGSSAEDVPDLGVLLVGPMARGATVTLGEAR